MPVSPTSAGYDRYFLRRRRFAHGSEIGEAAKWQKPARGPRDIPGDAARAVEVSVADIAAPKPARAVCRLSMTEHQCRVDGPLA